MKKLVITLMGGVFYENYEKDYTIKMELNTTMDCIFDCFEGKAKLINITTQKTTYQCQKCKQMWDDVTSNV